MKAVLDATGAAFYLDTTEGQVREMVKLGQLPYKKRGGKLIFRVKDLDAWLDQLPGLTVAEAVRRLSFPADFAAPTVPEPPETTLTDSQDDEPIQLQRGARGSHSLEVRGSGSR